jgi:hypothetical protein
MEATNSSETPVLTSATWRHIRHDGILYFPKFVYTYIRRVAFELVSSLTRRGYITGDGILHCHRSEHLKFYINSLQLCNPKVVAIQVKLYKSITSCKSK